MQVVLLFYLKDDPPSQYMESSIEDPAPGEVIAEIQPVTFQIVESGTKRRKTSLMDSLGWTERRDWLPSPLGLCLIRSWSGSRGNSTETYRRGCSTAGKSLRGKRRPQHSYWKYVHISTARLVGTKEDITTHNQKTAPLGATKFAKENDQQ